MLHGALPSKILSVVLLVSTAAAVPYDFKDNYKSSSASQDGQPASFNVPLTTGRLPYDIAGVVGGYVLAVLIWGILLLTIGRRMRRKALEPPKALELELSDKPVRPGLRTSSLASPPLSARSATSWLKRFKKTDSVASDAQSPVVGSPTSFDQRVIDEHNARAQADMERLYAAVMDHDLKKANASNVSVNEVEPRAPAAERTPTERRRPSAISTTRLPAADESPISPVKAIYPPGYNSNGPMTAPMPRSSLRDQQPPASPHSIMSKHSEASHTTTRSKNARFNLKNLRISGPVPRYPGVDSDDEAHTPLSPRFYQPGPPPSPPTQTNSPTSPYDPEELDRVQPLPRPTPHRLNTPSSSSSQKPHLQLQPSQPGITLTHPSSPSTHSIHSTTSTGTATATKSLPLRSFATPLKSPGIQTTVLDRRVEQLSLQTPRTGVPFTPYSPYMPFTPITPVTPHLVSKKDRKRAEKVEARRLRAVREDMVQSPKEIFGDAY